MDTLDPVSRLRHDISNPLAALLAEVQLMLMSSDQLDSETANGLREVEKLARRMRQILQNQA